MAYSELFVTCIRSQYFWATALFAFEFFGGGATARQAILASKVVATALDPQSHHRVPCCGEKPYMEEFEMQEMRTRDSEIKSLFESASKIAHRYGRIGMTEPEDIVQETMLKVLSKDDGRKPSVAWMRVVLRNIAIDKMRGSTRDFKNMVSETDADDERGSILECDLASKYKPEPMDFDVMPKLREMLAKLSQPLQRVLMLHVEGYSYEEIASMTRVNIGTVRSRLFYARRKARELLRDLQY